MPAADRTAAADDMLVAGATREFPAWTTPVLVLASALAVAASVVVTQQPVTIDGHGSRALPPAHAQYQPYLGRPVF